MSYTALMAVKARSKPKAKVAKKKARPKNGQPVKYLKPGRPTKYNQWVAGRVEYYMATGYTEDGSVVPTIEGVCHLLRVCEKTLWNWSKRYPAFERVLGRLKRLQKQMLISKGLDGKYNSTIAKLLLSCNHDMNEKQEYEVGGNVTVEIVNYAGNKGKTPT